MHKRGREREGRRKRGAEGGREKGREEAVSEVADLKTSPPRRSHYVHGGHRNTNGAQLLFSFTMTRV